MPDLEKVNTRLLDNVISQREALKAEVEALKAEVARLNVEAGRDADGRLSHPTPITARKTYVEVQAILTDLHIDGIGVNNVIERVRWLVGKLQKLETELAQERADHINTLRYQVLAGEK